jgi:hypothetical protein
MLPLEEIFTYVDDFCKLFENDIKRFLVENNYKKKRNRPMRMYLSEIITIVVLFQLNHYKTFKDYYNNYILKTYKREFPNTVSYSRFVTLMQYTLMPMTVLISSLKGEETGIYYVDSTKLTVCNNLRTNRNKVFKDIAKRGKTITGWFFGFKLNVIINNKGEIMNIALIKENIDDRKPVEKLVANLKGWFFGDKKYINKELKESLLNKRVELITNIKKGMKKIVIKPTKKFLLGKRYVIETVFDQWKNLLNINHIRHKFINNFMVNILETLIAYQFKLRKPSVSFAKLNGLVPVLM